MIFDLLRFATIALSFFCCIVKSFIVVVLQSHLDTLMHYLICGSRKQVTISLPSCRARVVSVPITVTTDVWTHIGSICERVRISRSHGCVQELCGAQLVMSGEMQRLIKSAEIELMRARHQNIRRNPV